MIPSVPAFRASIINRPKVKGQSLTELAILVSVVTMAILAMQLYVQRGLQARYKGGIDYFAGQIQSTSGVSTAGQYEPYYWQSQRQVDTVSDVTGGYPYSGQTSMSTQSGQSVYGPAEDEE
jgi:hypothetical protein